MDIVCVCRYVCVSLHTSVVMFKKMTIDSFYLMLRASVAELKIKCPLRYKQNSRVICRQLYEKY